jgi:hypothetical protein
MGWVSGGGFLGNAVEVPTSVCICTLRDNVPIQMIRLCVGLVHSEPSPQLAANDGWPESHSAQLSTVMAMCACHCMIALIRAIIRPALIGGS